METWGDSLSGPILNVVRTLTSEVSPFSGASEVMFYGILLL